MSENEFVEWGCRELRAAQGDVWKATTAMLDRLWLDGVYHPGDAFEE